MAARTGAALIQPKAQQCPKCLKNVHYVDPPGWWAHDNDEVACWVQDLPASKVSFYEAVAAYLRRTEPDRAIGRVVDIEERTAYGFTGSDVTPGEDPWLELDIAWLADNGFTYTSKYFGSFTELMRELDRPNYDQLPGA
jgi:hypothetical protein